MKRRFASLLLACSLTMGLATSAAAFSDVPASIWYATAVGHVTEGGLMNGTSDTTFTPDGHVTRGMLATVLWRLADMPQPKEKAPFPDVDEWFYYADAAAWAAENRIAAGYSNGTFSGGDSVTREQLAMFLYRYALLTDGDTGSGVLDIYPDADKISGWAKDGVSHAVGLGLITGRDNGALDPLGSATRAQLAVILQRLMTPAVG